MRSGIDPVAVKKQTQQTILLAEVKTKTFEECAEGYFAAHAVGWSAKMRKGWQQTMKNYVYPTIGKLTVAAVDTALVRQCVEPIWRTKTATANNVRRRIEGVWSWAKTHGYCSGDNPARWDGHLEHSLASVSKVRKTQHHAALPYTAIGAFMVALQAKEGFPAKALEMAILTATRTNETLGAKWTEIDLENKVWTIPASRMKAGKEHRVPLCPRLVDCCRHCQG